MELRQAKVFGVLDGSPQNSVAGPEAVVLYWGAGV